MAKRWSQEEIDFLTKNYANMDLSELAEKLGRSTTAVRSKAQRMSLSRKATNAIPVRGGMSKETSFPVFMNNNMDIPSQRLSPFVEMPKNNIGPTLENYADSVINDMNNQRFFGANQYRLNDYREFYGDEIEEMRQQYLNNQISGEDFKNYVDNIQETFEDRVNSEIDFNDRIDDIERLYSEGQLSDQEYADALNNAGAQRTTVTDRSIENIVDNETNIDVEDIIEEPQIQFNPDEVDPNLHFNQQHYSKYKMNEHVFDEYKPSPETPLSYYDQRMKEYSDYIKEYEDMQKLASESNFASEQGARNYEENREKLEKFFGKDKYGTENARLKYEEAKIYGPHRDNPNDPLARDSEAWWDEHSKRIKERRIFNKNKKAFEDSNRAKIEAADTEFINEFERRRDLSDLRRTKGNDYLNANPDLKKSVEEAEAWLAQDVNKNRYESIPEEFRKKVTGDIDRKRFEVNKSRRNAKLDADYEKFKSQYDTLTLRQKDRLEERRKLESDYRRSGKDPDKQARLKKDIDEINEDIKDIKSQRKGLKRDMKRTNSKTRNRASNIREEIRDIKNQINDNKIYQGIQESYVQAAKENPNLTFEQFLEDNANNTRFKDFKPLTDPELETLGDELKFRKNLLKEQAGIDITKEEGDIVNKITSKIKGADRINLAISGITAIGKYKDSRKEGRGVVSSVVRAGVDFAASQVMGPGLYMGLSIAREAPKAFVTGATYLQNEVRQMNTASRFRVFGDASFQDSDNLATMRQSGMELAKMANYNLEQTLMGNEARYLHR